MHRDKQVRDAEWQKDDTRDKQAPEREQASTDTGSQGLRDGGLGTGCVRAWPHLSLVISEFYLFPAVRTPKSDHNARPSPTISSHRVAFLVASCLSPNREFYPSRLARGDRLLSPRPSAAGRSPDHSSFSVPRSPFFISSRGPPWLVCSIVVIPAASASDARQADADAGAAPFARLPRDN